jgi:hypothetical protein
MIVLPVFRMSIGDVVRFVAASASAVAKSHRNDMSSSTSGGESAGQVRGSARISSMKIG